MEVGTRSAQIELPEVVVFLGHSDFLKSIWIQSAYAKKKKKPKQFNRHLSGLGTHSQEEMTNEI